MKLNMEIIRLSANQIYIDWFNRETICITKNINQALILVD